MKRRAKALLMRLKKNISLPEMKILPGQLAFFFVLTVVPILALVLSIGASLKIPTNLVDELTKLNFPGGLTSIIQYVSGSDAAHINTIIFFVSALVLASNGTYSMIIASNQIYKFKNKGYIFDRIKSIYMMIILILLMIFIILVPILGEFIVKAITVLLKDDSIQRVIYWVYKLLNLPLTWFFIFFLVKLLYTLAPDEPIPSKNVNYGALFTSLSWLVFTKIYTIYVNTFGGYSSLYGSISSLIVLMWWIYFLAYLFVLGMALNLSKYNQKKE